MFSSNPAKSLGEKALSGQSAEMANKVQTLADEAKSQAEMADKAKNIASQMKSQAEKADKVASELKSQADMADKAKNLAGELGSQGLSSTGGVGLGSAGLGGLGSSGVMGASAAGIGGQAANAIRSGTGKTDNSSLQAFNRDSSHSGYGGHNTNTDMYGRDTTNSETYGRGTTKSGMNEGYSTGNERGRREYQGNTGTSAAFGTRDLARDTGAGTHHHATNKEFGTTSTQTGIHSGDGIHSQQYYGRTDDSIVGGGSTYVSGGSSGIGHHPHAAGQVGTGIGHHQAGEGVHAQQYIGRSTGAATSETVAATGIGMGHDQHSHHTDDVPHNLKHDCEFCHKYASAEGETTKLTNTTVPASSTQDKNKTTATTKATTTGVAPSSARNINKTSTATNAPTSSTTASGSANQGDIPPYGETRMTTTTSTNTTEGPSPYHLRVGETIVEKETRVHRGVAAGTAHTTVSSQSTAVQTPDMGGSVSQPQQRRKPSFGEKLMDKMKTHPNADTIDQAARTRN